MAIPPRLPKSIVKEMSKIIKRIDKKALLVFIVWGIATIIGGKVTALTYLAGAVSVAYIVWQVRMDE